MGSSGSPDGALPSRATGSSASKSLAGQPDTPSRPGRIRVEVQVLMIVAPWRSGVLVLIATLVPVLGAVWGIRWFVTQDGSAHLYNAHIIASSLGPTSPFAAYYVVRWEALPNWSGHLVTAALVSLMPAWAAGPAITTLTLVGFAVSIVWLRMRVTGPSGLSLASVLAVLPSPNFPWLPGFPRLLVGARPVPVPPRGLWGGRP